MILATASFRSFAGIVLCLFLLGSNYSAKVTPSRQAPKKEKRSTITSRPAPKFPNSNGFFVLYYGDGKDEDELKNFERIRGTEPSFVVVGYFAENPGESVDLIQAKNVLCVLRGGNAKDCAQNPVLDINQTGIRTIYYVTADGDDTFINSQIQSVMKLGYDGIFFDETNRQTEPSQNDRYKTFAKSVHSFNSKDERIVIVNPGVSDDSVCPMFKYADIVSVENHWNKEVPKCMGIDKNRWLAVQGDPSDEHGDYAQPPKSTELKKAIQRLNCFRKNGGLWYFTTGWNDGQPVHWRLPDFLESFAAEAKKQDGKCDQ